MSTSRTTTRLRSAFARLACAVIAAFSSLGIADAGQTHRPSRLGAADSSAAASAEGPSLGVPASAADIAAIDVSIRPDSASLPPGSGTPSRARGIRNQVHRLSWSRGPME
jgi:hypothetical protein